MNRERSTARHIVGAVIRTIAWALTATGASAAAPPPPPPAEAFGRLPAVDLVAISPDGSLLALDASLPDGHQRIAITDPASGKVLRVVDVDAKNRLRNLRWSDNQTVLVEASQKTAWYCGARKDCPQLWSRWLSIDVQGSAPKILLMKDVARSAVSGASLLSVSTNRPSTVTMETLDFSLGRYHQSTGTRLGGDSPDDTGWTSVVFAVDTRTGKGQPLATGTRLTRQWVVDANGMPVARAEWDPELKRYSVLASDGANWREIFRPSDGISMTLAGLTPDGKAIVALGANGGAHSRAWAIPLDGSAPRVLFEEADGDIEDYEVDGHTNAVVRVTGAEDHWLDPTCAKQQRSLASAFGGKRITLIDRSASGQRVIVKVDSSSLPPVYYLVDFDKGKADIVGEAYPELARATLGTVKSTSYTARDGTIIPAYLTLPPGSDGKNLPVVVLPHGGPQAHDLSGFDWLAQFLATRGYAVLQPEFRGSTGYGEAFRKAGYRQWGGLMQDDVSDGVRHLIADGTADPKRICIVGASYGGYAALAGAAFTPELYACAASISGIADLPLFVGDKKRQFGDNVDDVQAIWDTVGPPTDPSLAARSPVRAASRVQAPVLLLHGEDDSVVPIAQSEEMAKALQDAGKRVTFVRLPGEDHWLSRSETRIRVLKELDAFLAQSLQAH